MKFYRLTNAVKIGIWAFMNPHSLQESNFQMISKLLGIIFKVATENRPMMSHIAYIHPDEGEKQIVSIWAGAGLGADPMKRIEELLRENSMLRAKISSQVEQSLTKD